MRDLLKPKNRAKLIVVASCSALFVLLIIFVIWSTTRNSIAESEIIHLDDENIEVIMRDTAAFADLSPLSDEHSIYLQQGATQKLNIVLDLPGIADVSIFDSEGNHLKSRRAFLDEEFILLPTGEAESYTISVTHIETLRPGGSGFLVEPQYSDLYSYDASVVFPSPSCLQMTLFAHMAFFPFDFNQASSPLELGHTQFHYQPFYEFIISDNTYGFDFHDQMTGWNLSGTYNDFSTGFRASIFVNDSGCRTVLAFRGAYGDVFSALTEQTGTWWCNFNAITGYPHSHVRSMQSFLYQHMEMLADTRIYLTGHSLGGYLSYIATYELVQMGLEKNIRRAVAFSAPIFTADTIELMRSLSPVTRARIAHFYVPEDLIAGFVGIEMPGEFPGYDPFAVVSQLFETMRTVRGTDIPFTVEAISNMLAVIEILFPISLPYHISELIWRLNGAFGEEALALSNEFKDIVLHIPVAHTWHSPRPDPDWPIGIDLIRDLLADIVFDMVDRIFDADTHFMMNFYSHFAN